MISKEKADEIWEKVREEWIKRYGEENLDSRMMELTKKMIRVLPDKDGRKRITSVNTLKTHLVPVEEIILNGINEENLQKYPEEKNE